MLESLHMSENIILASGSPRRRELLSWTGLSFKVCPAEVNETPLQLESPMDYVSRLAVEKARSSANGFNGREMVLAADTTVADGNQILGKPRDARHAREMLAQLRGRNHQVFTALALFVPAVDRMFIDGCESNVPMRDYTDCEIDAYITSGDPMDKAGAYAIQNRAFQPVSDFKGCFANVMGLPLCHLTRVLEKTNIRPAVDVPETCQANLQYTCPIFSSVLAGQDVG